MGSSLREQKRALKNAWKEQERQRLLASIPIPHQALRDLFDRIGREDVPICDHTLRETTAFLKERRLPVDRTIEWLKEHGGHCDCEVLNVEDEFEAVLKVPPH